MIKRTPSWSVKVDRDGVLRYISLSVIMNGGAEENRTPVRKDFDRTFSGCRQSFRFCLA